VPFQLTIVTPQGSMFDGPVENVVLPGTEGDFGVLESHERLLAPLRIGSAEIHEAGGITYAAIADGFAQVDGDQVVVLVESCEVDGDLDMARAQLAHDRAEQGLKELGADVDEKRRLEFEAALERARNRLEVAKRG
jgi:F-type H+-transporting ATPase subunit epsilon